jgi:hypothetical protein
MNWEKVGFMPLYWSLILLFIILGPLQWLDAWLKV